MPITKLNRSVIRLSGEGLYDWLNGLITNSLNADINFAALLTPQGKIIADFFVVKDADDWLIDTPTKFKDNLIKRLKMYKLRAPIEITESDLNVYALWGGQGEEGFVDPRHEELGKRLLTADDLPTEGDYNAHRLSLGVPDSEFDFGTQEMFPADANMDLLNGVDFKKGCFVGQEVVSRMKRKTEVRKRMRGFSYDGTLSSTDIKAGARVVGQVLHSHVGQGMTLIRLDRLAATDEVPMVEGTEISLLE